MNRSMERRRGFRSDRNTARALKKLCDMSHHSQLAVIGDKQLSTAHPDMMMFRWS